MLAFFGWFLLWYIVGLLISSSLLYMEYKDSRDIVLQDLTFVLLISIAGPIIIFPVIGIIFQDYKNKVIIKGRNNDF